MLTYPTTKNWASKSSGPFCHKMNNLRHTCLTWLLRVDYPNARTSGMWRTLCSMTTCRMSSNMPITSVWLHKINNIELIPSRFQMHGGRNWMHCLLSAVSSHVQLSWQSSVVQFVMQSKRDIPSTSSNRHQNQFPPAASVSSIQSTMGFLHNLLLLNKRSISMRSQI